MSQQGNSSSQVPSVETAASSGLATINYGTMEHNKSLASGPSITTSNTQSPLNEPPRPALRRKIQQQPRLSSTGATDPLRMPPSSEEMSVINETIQEIDRQRSSLTDRTKQPSDAKDSASEIVSNPIEIADPTRTNLSLVEGPAKQTSTALGEDLQLLHQQQAPTRPYPKKVLFIIANEFCERFSYYGLRTVLVLYFRSVLGLSDSGSTVSYHLFATLCYLTPILGAILGDSILGKYKTILYLSIVYFLGELVLVLSSIFWDLSTLSVLITWTGLLLIGIGTGGIKPCVAAFAGDQFLPNESGWRESFFSLFYGAINLGSLISMFVTPLLRSNYGCVGRNDCYPYAFGLPCLLIFIATVVFLLAHNHYYISPLPEQNVIIAFCQCTWLALKRKWSGLKVPTQQQLIEAGHVNHSHLTDDGNPDRRSTTPSPLGSSMSITSSENESKPVAPTVGRRTSLNRIQQTSNSGKRNHWLYLASDKFDKNSIEEFRSVLGILLLFLPTPVYWCLFDQQGSLWTLQATRMDGRVFNSNYVLEPDQMMVANPILLLASIPLFQLIIYPTLTKCNLLTTPIQRMAAGGFIAALSFVASGLIEFQLQQNLPREVPLAGHANLLLVNGLGDCAMVEPVIAFKQPPVFVSAGNQTSEGNALNPYSSYGSIESLEPLSVRQLSALPASTVMSVKLSFRLTGAQQQQVNQSNLATSPTNRNSLASVGCPFDEKQVNEVVIGPLSDQTVRLVYVEQGNGKLAYKMFNESLALPAAGKARVRLLYEIFGSFASASKRKFYLAPINTPKGQQHNKEFSFNFSLHDGQVLLSDYLDVEITSSNDHFALYTNDNSLVIRAAANRQTTAMPSQLAVIKLEPGTRNLLILQQLDAKNAQFKHELLQDNSYRISVLYQLIPYTMISMSEVMFSITGLEFSYSMAPPNLKSLILGAWSLTTALGNILTVAVESFHPFANIAHDFLFYAALMALDMGLFAILGYYYEPYQPYRSQSKSKN